MLSRPQSTEEKQDILNICSPNTVEMSVKELKKDLKNLRTKRLEEETRANERHQ